MGRPRRQSRNAGLTQSAATVIPEQHKGTDYHAWAWFSLWFLILAILSIFWYTGNKYTPVASPTGQVIYSSSSSATKTELWITHHFGKNLDPDSSEIRFLHRITDSSAKEINFTVTLSGDYVGNIDECGPLAEVSGPISRSSLPVAHETALNHYSELQEESAPQENAGEPVSNKNFDKLEFEVVEFTLLLEEESEEGEAGYVGTGGISCDFNSEEFTERTPLGFRTVMPPTLYVGTPCRECLLNTFSQVEAETDESFYYLRGTEYLDTVYSDDGNTELRSKKNEYIMLDDIKLVTQEEMSTLFFSEFIEFRRELLTLGFGALSGVAISSIVAFFERRILNRGT